MAFLAVQQPSHPVAGVGASGMSAALVALVVLAVVATSIWMLAQVWRDSRDGGARRLVAEAERWLRNR
ncbi:MAG: hypothetical protein ACP5P1_12860 [Acidimicrobiales bacterium]